jgi:hypothetical protein
MSGPDVFFFLQTYCKPFHLKKSQLTATFSVDLYVFKRLRRVGIAQKLTKCGQRIRVWFSTRACTTIYPHKWLSSMMSHYCIIVGRFHLHTEGENVVVVVVTSMPPMGFETSIPVFERAKIFWNLLGAGIAQSVQRLATGWPTEGSEFESRWCQEFSLRYVVQTGSGVHPTYYPMDTGGSFPGSKAVGAWSWPLTT